MPPLKRRKKKPAVLDLSACTACRLSPAGMQLTRSPLDLAAADDDEISFAGSSSPAKPTQKNQPRPDKGKGKEKQVVSREEEQDDHQLWVDKYAPQCRVRHLLLTGDACILLSDLTSSLNWRQDDLSVHARKVTDVENWFNEAYSSNPKLAKWRRVLVLSGPAGAGKTAVVKMLAKDMDAEIVEWQEGQSGKTVDDDPGEQDATLGSSQAQCFRYHRTVALIEVDPLPHRPRIARAPVHVLSRSSRDGPRARFRSRAASPFHLDLKLCAAQVILAPSTSIQLDPSPPPPPHPPRGSPQRLSLAHETGPPVRRTAVLVLAARDGSARHHRE